MKSCIFRNDSISPDILAERFEESRINDGEKVKFEGFSFDQYNLLLFNLIQFPKGELIPELDARNIVRTSIFKASETGKITKARLLNQINKQFAEYINKPLIRYFIHTTISLDFTSKMKGFKFEGVTLIFEPSSTCVKEIYNQDWFKSLIKERGVTIPIQYLNARIYISARSTESAMNQGLRALNFFRGLWNFELNRNSFSRSTYGGKIPPVNKIIIGPVQTLFNLSGKVAQEGIWYPDITYDTIKPLKINDKELEPRTKNIQIFRKWIKNSKFSDQLIDAFINYAMVLDDSNLYNSFIGLWNLFEDLTGAVSGKRTDYDQAIKRAAFLYEDRDFAYHTLSYLRDYRNRYVHSNFNTAHIEAYLYQLKSFVETLLGFHIRNIYKFKSFSDSIEFLDNPFSKEGISDQLEKSRNKLINLNNAAKFQRI